MGLTTANVLSGIFGLVAFENKDCVLGLSPITDGTPNDICLEFSGLDGFAEIFAGIVH